MSVRVRFAPSPTGYLHIGGARTALFNWLYARHQGGQFVLRIEDTDRERSTPEAVQAILDGIAWLGLDWDEGPFFQTQRGDSYRAAIERLRERGRAYECTCTQEELQQMRAEAMAEKRKPKYDGRCRERPSHPERPAVLRFRAPDEGVTVVEDLVKGRVEVDNRELDDLIIARTDGSPTYNFCVVVDDHEMEISHVIRGDDHLNNTPRQIQMYEALGWALPRFAHVPMILGADHKRLSKRHGATAVTEYRDQGYLPWSVVNYLARLGWSAGDEELFSREGLIEAFSIEGIGSSAAVFNPEKLDWVNAHYLRELEPVALASSLAPFLESAIGRTVRDDPRLPKIAALFQARAKTLAEMAAQAAFLFLADAEIEYEEKGRRKFLTQETASLLEELQERLSALPTFDEAALEQAFHAISTERDVKLGKIAQPTRVALTGGTASPGIYEVIALLGREVTLTRLQRARDWIADQPSA